MSSKVRVRFAPSPTGGLHLGGVRTALFNYLFAKQHAGTFVLRIEDTDQSRFVPGAEEYINQCLQWCGIAPDESPEQPGAYGPYRQSERKADYRPYAEQLIEAGFAYYAFDTPAELEVQRKSLPNFQYGQHTRMQMRNSLSLSFQEVEALLSAGTPHVIRIKMPEQETVYFTDLIRGEVSFDTSLVDDKVLLKADGMPTYHLAVVVDDKAMDITHIFRGEEWLPSAPIHILLWKYLGWEAEMPQWAHLPLILKPDGHGKLSKRDGDRLGFPVFAMNWQDPQSAELAKGFKEMGFLPEAFINMLALLGWNDGSGQELFSLAELVQKFDLSRINKSGAKFDFDKAKWFNQEWIKASANTALLSPVKTLLEEVGLSINDEAYLLEAISLVKDRCVLLPDFLEQLSFFFKAPDEIDFSAVKSKWSIEKTKFFEDYIQEFEKYLGNSLEAENHFKQKAADAGLKVGEVMMPLRMMLVGGKFGPGVFDIAKLLGAAETESRIRKGLQQLQA